MDDTITIMGYEVRLAEVVQVEKNGKPKIAMTLTNLELRENITVILTFNDTRTLLDTLAQWLPVIEREYNDAKERN